MSLYQKKESQLNLLHSYGRQQPKPIKLIETPKTPDEAAHMLLKKMKTIKILKNDTEMMASIPAETLRLIGDCAQFNQFKKATTYRQYSRCDHQNLSVYLATAKALGFEDKQITDYWLKNIGKGNGGASYPMPMVLNLRTVKGDNCRFRWYANRRAHQIEAFLFAQYDERNDGSAYVTTNGFCQRWHVSNAPQKTDAKGKAYYQLNTHLLKQQGILQPFSVMRELVEGYLNG